MSFRFHPDAADEFRKAVDYYEGTEPGLGYDFSLEVYAAIQRAAAHPQAFECIGGDIRRALVHRFPYGLLYAAEDEELLIVAVMHLHRRPGYWADRV